MLPLALAYLVPATAEDIQPMSQEDTAHAWWSRLRHQGLLLSPVVMLERYPSAPQPAPFHDR